MVFFYLLIFFSAAKTVFNFNFFNTVDVLGKEDDDDDDGCR